MDFIVRGNYDDAIASCRRSRLTSRDMRVVIERYGWQLISPPKELFHNLDAVELRNSQSSAWSVRLPLWTEEEGRSDLEVELTVTVLDGFPTINLDDLRVL
jgi:hypothetical protein